VAAAVDLRAGQAATVVRTDFRVISVREYIGTDPSAINTDFPFVGSLSSVKRFQIDGVPVEDAYMLITHSRLIPTWHVVKINDRDLPGIIFPSEEGATHLMTIPHGFLVRGLNTLQISVKGAAAIVYHLVVHWRERELPPPPPPVHP
jgi:hypothetical protein